MHDPKIIEHLSLSYCLYG